LAVSLRLGSQFSSHVFVAAGRAVLDERVCLA
jgi:hypothetical protein